MTGTVERMLPLYEGKMIHQFDHRWATYGQSGRAEPLSREQKLDRQFRAIPRYWVREDVADVRLPEDWAHNWISSWRDICRSTDERTLISTIVGDGARPEGGLLLGTLKKASLAPLLVAIWNSFVVDFVARQMVGGTHLKFYTMRQLPILDPKVFEQLTPWSRDISVGEWLGSRSVSLLNTADDMADLVNELQAEGLPNRSVVSRSQRRAELDAACFHLYGIERDDVDYIMETFPIVKRKDVAEFGEYRTKEMILQVYDAMAQAIATGVPFASPFENRKEPAADA